MGKKQRSCKEAGSRAWRMLRLALLWARRGGVLKSGLISDLRQGLKHLTRDKHDKKTIWYGERQLSFDDTPIIRFKTKQPISGSTSLRFLLPSCIQPADVDFDFDFDNDDDDDVGWCRKGYVENNAEDNKYREQCEAEEMVMMNAAMDFFSMQTSSSS